MSYKKYLAINYLYNFIYDAFDVMLPLYLAYNGVALADMGMLLAIFPLVFLLSFVYDAMCGKWEKTPRILLMLLCTFLGVLAAALMVYFYLGASLTPAAPT